MKIGQRYSGNGYISNRADYIQFDICGLDTTEIVQRYFSYKIDRPMVLLGDYISEQRNVKIDNMLGAERIYEVKEAIKTLQAFKAEIWGITLEPLSRKGLEKIPEIDFSDFVNKISEILGIPVFIKNTSNKDLFLSNPEEIISFSKSNLVTIDIEELYKTCDSNIDILLKTANDLNKENIKEVHIRQLGKDKSKDLYRGKSYRTDMSRFINSKPMITLASSDGFLTNQFEDTVDEINKLSDETN